MVSSVHFLFRLVSLSLSFFLFLALSLSRALSLALSLSLSQSIHLSFYPFIYLPISLYPSIYLKRTPLPLPPFLSLFFSPCLLFLSILYFSFFWLSGLAVLAHVQACVGYAHKRQAMPYVWPVGMEEERE